MLKGMSDMLQEVYLDFLDKIYILFPNMFFRILFTLYKPFISSKFRDKFVMLTSQEDLLKNFDPKVLPKEQGGLLNNPQNFITLMQPLNKNIYFNNKLKQSK